MLGRNKNAQNGHKRAFIYHRDDSMFRDEFKNNPLKWVFDFEYVSPEVLETLPAPDQKQYNPHVSANNVREEVEGMEARLREQATEPGSAVVYRQYRPTSVNTELTRQTGKAANGKRFAIGHVDLPDSFLEYLYMDLFSAISSQYPKPTRHLDVYALEDVFHHNSTRTAHTAHILRTQTQTQIKTHIHTLRAHARAHAIAQTHQHSAEGLLRLFWQGRVDRPDD